MPAIPSFTAQPIGGQVSQGRVSPSTETAQGLASAGAAIQGIGSALADFRDRDDMVNAQLNYERDVISLNDKYKELLAGATSSQEFDAIRESRKNDIADIAAKSLDGVSNRVRRELSPEFEKSKLADGVRFDADATKAEGAFRVNNFEKNKNMLLNKYVYADSESSLADAQNSISRSIDAVSPYLPADKVEGFKNQVMGEAKYLRAKSQVEPRVRAGEEFNASEYASDLEPRQILQLKSDWNNVQKNIIGESNAFYNERIADHRTTMLNKGKDDGLADQMIAQGNYKKAAQIQAQDKIDKIIYDTTLAASAASTTGSINDIYDGAMKVLDYDSGDTMAAEKQKGIDYLESKKGARIKELEADANKKQSEYNKLVRQSNAEVRQIVQDGEKNHFAVLASEGVDDGYADRLEEAGGRKEAERVRQLDEVYREIYYATQETPEDGIVTANYDDALKRLSVVAGDPMAAKKMQAKSDLLAARQNSIKRFLADPASDAMQMGVVRNEGEPASEYAGRLIAKQHERAGDKNFSAKILSVSQTKAIQQDIQSALDANDSQRVVGMISEIKDYGQYQHQVLSELGLDSSLHVAMDAQNDAMADVIVKLSGMKSAKEVNPEYMAENNVSNILGSDFIQYLTEKIERDPSPQLTEYRASMIGLAHKWIASGRDLNELFSMYNVQDSGRGTVIMSQGINEDDFEDGAENVLMSLDYSRYVPSGNPYKTEVVNRLKTDSQLVDAASSDNRVPKGERGFYVWNPSTGGVLVDQVTGDKMLLLENEIMSKSIVPNDTDEVIF